MDDEENIRFLLDVALRHLGFEVELATTGREAIDKVASTKPDLVVLDVMLPDLDGFEVCRRLRAEGSRTPVLFLTARDATEDKVRGLTIGGDDYVEKPFSLEELVARVQAVLRRAGLAQPDATLRCADLELDDDAHRVVRAGTEIALSPTEYKLLRYLSSTRAAWCRGHRSSTTCGSTTSAATPAWWRPTSATYATSSTAEPRLIQTVRGVGYSLPVAG